MRKVLIVYITITPPALIRISYDRLLSPGLASLVFRQFLLLLRVCYDEFNVVFRSVGCLFCLTLNLTVLWP